MATAFTNANVVDYSGQPRGYKLDKRGILKVYVQRINFDAIATGTAVALAADDTFQAFTVRANETILQAGVKILKAASGASVFDLGFTGGTVDFFVDGLAANSLTGHTAVNSTDGFFTTNVGTETIDLKTLTASGAGCVADVFMVVLRIGNN